MIYENFDQLVRQINIGSKEKKVVAVMAAEDSHTLEAVVQAGRVGVIESILIGDKGKIREQLTLLDENPAKYSIIHAKTSEEVVLKATGLVNDGEAQFLMKGLLRTGEMMRTLLSEKASFRTDRQMTHLSVVKIPNYHKLIGLTDVALSILPDLALKRVIVENAVSAMSVMGFDAPKVAILAAVETVNPKMPDTVDAAALKKLNIDGSIPGCTIEGPISYDLAISQEAAELKGYESQVCGDVDLLVVPNLATGNVLLKALRYSAQASSAGIVVGGKVPLVLTSRAAEVASKYLPIILAAAASSAKVH
ncbi:MAG: pta 3 [Firmicutes bacterium]|nr:pta 3 [Bacillota bacterium]